MTKLKNSQLEKLANEIVAAAQLELDAREYSFISTVVRLIEPTIVDWYRNVNLQPPQTATISRWFYKSEPPDWAIALLLNEKQKILARVSPKCQVSPK